MSSLTPQLLPLDPALYNLKAEEIAFFKACTGIHDDDELRKHITEVQTEAYAVGRTISLCGVAQFRLRYTRTRVFACSGSHRDYPLELCLRYYT